MISTVVGYLGFVVAALILIWAVFEMTRRVNRRKKIDARTLNTWVKLDSSRANASDETHPITGDENEPDEDTNDNSNSELHTRAHQNGHYSESKKPL